MNLSLYVHLPFCSKKCRYCDFYSIQLQQQPLILESFQEALLRQWDIIQYNYQINNFLFDTVFFGGGTPSLIPSAAFEKLCSALIPKQNLNSSVEWTVECNPESFTEKRASTYLACGVTRLTFGVQSLQDRELRCLGRIHTSQTALKVLSMPILENFHSIGIDLMYGIPGQTLSSFRDTIEHLFGHTRITHLSCYELTCAKHTPFGRHASLLPLPSEETVHEMTELLHEITGTHGLYQYEVSNYAKPGFECKHNRCYWTHKPYIGLGPGAHSFINNKRFACVQNLYTFIHSLAQGVHPLEFEEIITPQKLASEILLLRLRTKSGLDIEEFERMTSMQFLTEQRKVSLSHLQQQGMIVYTDMTIQCTKKGIFFADGIAALLA